VIRRALSCVFAASLVSCTSEQPHACSPPRTNWNKPHNFIGLMPAMNRLSLDHAGKLYWNGSSISFQTLSKYLTLVHQMNPEPRVFLEIEAGAPCDSLERVRNEMERKLACDQYSACEEGIYSVWKELPTPPRTPPS
jgi:biopolymer transport protein ExbD